ncbi:MAG: RNA-binding protein [Proteobacteria bacterium]|nr:RNA-binding protein [Pseudomonadota bacterium]
MGFKLYVGNLAYSATENSVTTLFSKEGTVDSVQLITDRETGRSKGFGFVEMSTKEEADNAIANLNGHELEGRVLTVNEARPKTQAAMGRSDFGSPRRAFDRGGQRHGV